VEFYYCYKTGLKQPTTSTSKAARCLEAYLDTATTSETSSTIVVEGRATTSRELVLFPITALRTLVGGLVGGRNDLGGQSQVTTEVFNTFVSQVAVVVLPREGDTDVTLGLKRLHQVQNLQVGRSFDLRMSGGLGVLLDDTYSFLEQVREDCDAIFLGDEHDCVVVSLSILNI
jgi:hypothetical protein